MNLFEKELSSFINNRIDPDGLSKTRFPSSGDFVIEDGSKKYWAYTHAAAFEDLLKQEYGQSGLEDISGPLFIRPGFYQPLPRCIDSLGQASEVIKPVFSSFESLKRNLYWKAFLSVYTKDISFQNSKIVIFTYVMSDGLGDLKASEVAAGHLENEFFSVYRISLVPATWEKNIRSTSKNHLIHYYEDISDLNSSRFSDPIHDCLQNASLLLQIPTFYPHWQELLIKYRPQKHYTIGEYGFIDSTWAHPMIDNTVCMGLHYLEKGIWIQEQTDWYFSKATKDRVFENQSIESYQSKKDFVFAYLKTPEGVCSFFHTALSYYNHSVKDLDIVVTEVSSFLFLIKEERLLLADYGIRELHFSLENCNYVVPLGGKGKILRLIEIKYLDPYEALSYVRLSKALFACRGNQSFSEAVSFDTMFFYDAAPHAGPFLADLQGIIEHRLKEYPKAQEYLQGFQKVFSLKGNWAALAELGKGMGLVLQDESTRKGMRYLNSILKEEYSFNLSFLHLVRSLILHIQFPNLQRLHEMTLESCVTNTMSVKTALKRLEKEIEYVMEKESIDNGYRIQSNI